MDTPHTIMWLAMAALVFLLLIILGLDIYLYLCNTATLSGVIQKYFGGSLHVYRAALFGFLVGSLLTHFTRWK